MKALIESGNINIGIELGSTRIKAVMTDENGVVLAGGGVDWENKLEGGIFKTEGVAQTILASAISTPVAVNAAAGEGGAWGAAVLASYVNKAKVMPLSEFLDSIVFSSAQISVIDPDPDTQTGYEAFMENYNRFLKAEFSAVE